ncbi:MAG: alanine racemase [Xanthomonadales bacterium]|jgi:predicted amino acid racemase|nr:alanine racemase [Xanthomonadales bacterium]
MSDPKITIDLDIIEQNTRNVVSLCSEHGIEVTGVTKVTCGMPAVARALLRGGVKSIGESRLRNIKRLRAAGITAPFWLLRIPPLSAVEDIVKTCSLSLNSELGVIRALSGAAEERSLVHDILLMVDLGDLREGIWPDELLPVVEQIIELPGIRLRGLGTNLTCYGGVLPSRENMRALVDHKKRVEDTFSIRLDILSGGNSSSLDLLSKGGVPAEVNNLRLGESLMLGRETAYQKTWPGSRTDAFVIEAELIEAKEKPSLPIGETGKDAFGETPDFEDRGKHFRGILNVGREDVKVDGLTPVDNSVTILGASSDHLLVELGPSPAPLGNTLGFLPDYGALLAAMTSEYVGKEAHRSGQIKPEQPRPFLLCGTGWAALHPDLERPLGDVFSTDLAALAPESETRIEARSRPDYWLGNYRPVLLDHLGRFLEILDDVGQAAGCGLIWMTHELEGSFLMEHLRAESALPYPENTVVLGLREADQEAKDFLADHRITAYTMEDIDMLGMRQVMRQALHQAGSGSRGVFLRYNSNVTDGGNESLTRRETFLAMEMTARSGLLAGMDISPSRLDDAGQIDTLRRYVATAMGRRIL